MCGLYERLRTLPRSRKAHQSRDPEREDDERQDRVRPEARRTFGADDDAHRVDRGEHDPDRRQPRVQPPRERQHRRAGDQVCGQEEAHLERVAAEDVAHGELVVSEPHGLDARADLRQRRCEGEERRTEHDAVDAGAVGEAVAGQLERDARAERDDARDAEAQRDARRRLLLVRQRDIRDLHAMVRPTGCAPCMTTSHFAFLRTRSTTTMPAVHTRTIAIEEGLTTPPIATDAGSSPPSRTSETTTITSNPSRTGMSDPTRNVSGRRANRSQTTRTIVCVTIPPIRLPAARSRLPPSAADTVIATSGRLPATASRMRPPSSSPNPSRRSSASVVFESSTPASHVATAPPRKTSRSSGVDTLG